VSDWISCICQHSAL